MENLKIKKVETEIKRLVTAIGELEANGDPKIYGNKKYWDAGKYTGAIKRASMDLSRALTELRRP
jgi:hypothetical protein